MNYFKINFQASSVFVDNYGRVRLADYSIDKRYVYKLCTMFLRL